MPAHRLPRCARGRPPAPGRRGLRHTRAQRDLSEGAVTTPLPSPSGWRASLGSRGLPGPVPRPRSFLRCARGPPRSGARALPPVAEALVRRPAAARPPHTRRPRPRGPPPPIPPHPAPPLLAAPLCSPRPAALASSSWGAGSRAQVLRGWGVAAVRRQGRGPCPKGLLLVRKFSETQSLLRGCGRIRLWAPAALGDNWHRFTSQ